MRTQSILNTLTVYGNLTIGTNSTLDSKSYQINIGGNWVNNGIFLEQFSVILFDGSGIFEGGARQKFYFLHARFWYGRRGPPVSHNESSTDHAPHINKLPPT